MTTKSSKAKGRRLQKWVVNLLSHLTGLPGGKDKDIDSRGMGQTGVDIILRGYAALLFPYSIECKNQEKINIWDAIKQAKKNQLIDTEWLIVLAKNRTSPVVVLDAEKFFKKIFANKTI